MPLLPEQTVPYKTWIKTSLVESLRNVFDSHPDSRIRTHDAVRDGKPIKAGTKVSIEYPTSELHYPSIVVRFFEREVKNAGVGHVEYILVDELDSIATKFRHYLYDGDIEFAIFALSSLDRDLISDSLIQTLAMPDMAAYTKEFWDRIYWPEGVNEVNNKGNWNYVNLNTDKIQGFGETQTPQPWLSEDQLVYQTSYRLGIFGEFYSLPPVDVPSAGLIQQVNIYPYEQWIPNTPKPDGSVEGITIPTGSWTASDDDLGQWV